MEQCKIECSSELEQCKNERVELEEKIDNELQVRAMLLLHLE